MDEDVHKFTEESRRVGGDTARIANASGNFGIAVVASGRLVEQNHILNI